MEESEQYQIKEENIDIADLIIPFQEPDTKINSVKTEPNSEQNSRENSIIAKKPYQCEICSIRFSQKTSLSSHVASVHEGKKPVFQCDQCNKEFARKSGLTQHISVIHKGETVQCEFCNKQFSKSYLAYHISSVHEGKKPFECSFCKKTFSLKGHLKSHVTGVHEQNKPHKCGSCNHSFLNKQGIARQNELILKSFH